MRTIQTLPLRTRTSRLPPSKAPGDLFHAIDRLLVTWHKRRQFRTALRRMPDYLLHDIGLTEAQARDEAGKPFWQA